MYATKSAWVVSAMAEKRTTLLFSIRYKVKEIEPLVSKSPMNIEWYTLVMIRIQLTCVFGTSGDEKNLELSIPRWNVRPKKCICYCPIQLQTSTKFRIIKLCNFVENSMVCLIYFWHFLPQRQLISLCPKIPNSSSCSILGNTIYGILCHIRSA